MRPFPQTAEHIPWAVYSCGSRWGPVYLLPWTPKPQHYPLLPLRCLTICSLPRTPLASSAASPGDSHTQWPPVLVFLGLRSVETRLVSSRPGELVTRHQAAAFFLHTFLWEASPDRIQLQAKFHSSAEQSSSTLHSPSMTLLTLLIAEFLCPSPRPATVAVFVPPPDHVTPLLKLLPCFSISLAKSLQGPTRSEPVTAALPSCRFLSAPVPWPPHCSYNTPSELLPQALSSYCHL